MEIEYCQGYSVMDPPRKRRLKITKAKTNSCPMELLPENNDDWRFYVYD